MRSAHGLDTPTLDPQAWRIRANCTPDTAELFWPAGHSAGWRNGPLAREALRLCRDCPVIGDCHRYEVEHPVEFTHIAAGRIWGK